MNLPSNGVPLYVQIQDILLQRIQKGIYGFEQPLPSENDLLKEFNVTRGTIRNAIQLLQAKGAVITKRGKGTYVAPKKLEQGLFRFYSFGRDYSSKEYHSNTKVLLTEPFVKAEALPEKLAEISNVSFSRVTRIRYLESTPVLLELSYLPNEFAASILQNDLSEQSIYDILEHHHAVIHHAREYLNAVSCPEGYEALLEIPPGEALFCIERLTYDKDDRLLEFRTSYLRGDKFRFYIDLYE